MGDKQPTILMLAGEASGDQHGAGVARELKARWPGCRLLGLGGPAMREEGVELLADLDRLAVMGFAEVIRHLPFFCKLERRIREVLDHDDIDLVLPIDYPGFNLRMAKEAHCREIPVLYYIAPQVWAWKPGRISRLAEDCDHLAVILPFEVDVFRKAGAQVTFVGHPLLEECVLEPNEVQFRKRWKLDGDKPILALFPGSRVQEIARHRDLFLATGRMLQESRPGLQLVWAKASSIAASHFDTSGLPVVEDARSLLAHSRAALVKSGTTTLEAALQGTPFVTVYRTHPFTYMLARQLVQVDRVALANLVVGRDVVPELLQGAATPANLAARVEPLLDLESTERRVMVSGLADVQNALGEPGAAIRVAGLAAEVLAKV